MTEEPQPREWTIEFENDSVTITDNTGRGNPFPLRSDDLTLDTLLALSWYIATTPEEECELRLLQLLGRYLFELIFPTLQDHEMVPELTARRERFKGQCESAPGVRLNLRFAQSEARYAQLPWEFLRVETHNGHSFLADLEDVTVTLSRFLQTQTELSRCDPPIRILVHVSEPPDKPEISYTGLKTELESLEKESLGKLELRFRKDASLEEIQSDLKEYKPHVFHFSGHGDHDGFWLANGDLASARKALEVVGMSRQPFGFSKSVDPEVFKANIEAIGGLFSVHKPRLVVLDACSSDWSWLSEMLPGVAHQLVAKVPAVVAMRYPISNGAAEAFSLALYRSIVKGEPLDRAVQAARNQLRSPKVTEWSSRAFGTPILYLKGTGALCDPLLQVEETTDFGGDRQSTQARPCPRCHCPGLWTSTASRCTSCGVWFRCKNQKCRHQYTDAQIANLRFCSECEATYLDLPPLDKISQPGGPTAPTSQHPVPVGAAPSGLVSHETTGRIGLPHLEQVGLAPSSAGPEEGKLSSDSPNFDALPSWGNDEVPPS